MSTKLRLCHPVYDYDEDVKDFFGAHECVALAMHASAPSQQHPCFPLPQKVLLLPLGLVLLLLLLVLHDLELAVA